MRLDEYASYDGLGLSELVSSGETTAEELRACALEGVARLNPELNAVLQVLEEASAAEARAPQEGLFRGVPFLVKELICQPKDVPFRMGSRFTGAGVVHDYDTELMTRFRGAGLVTVGTTQTPEFGYNPTTETVAFGPVHNPWKAGHSPGGSSGGSGAAVAAGIVPVAHANDGGGSIRIPAACCGLVGLKPTRDRIPTGPDLSDPLFGLACEFVVSRSVRDSAALLDCVAGADPGAPGILPDSARSYAAELRESARPLRIAFTLDPASSWVYPECRAALDSAIALLEELGHRVVEASPEYDWDRFIETVHVPWAVFNATTIDALAEQLDVKPSPENLEAVTFAVYEDGKRYSACDLQRALDYHYSVSRAFGRFFEDIDVLVTPTLSRPPVPHGELDQNDASLSARDWTEKLFEYVSYTPQFNTTGQPAVSLPLHWSDAGLPVGVQFAGRFGDEATLLRLAGQLEEARPWRARRPPRHVANL
jgi:amidase